MANKAEMEKLALEVLDKVPPVTQLNEPLDYIFAEHFRQRVLCNVLDGFACGKKLDATLIASVLHFLRGDFVCHIFDEEQDLFPLLRRRARPDDRIEDVLGQLSEEHAADRLDAELITDGLGKALARGGKAALPARFAALLRRFAENERHHLTLENAIVLPIARVRLTADDLRNMAKRMAARRGINLPEPGNAV